MSKRTKKKGGKAGQPLKIFLRVNKIRAALMPFKRATSGEAKVTQVTVPIASLED